MKDETGDWVDDLDKRLLASREKIEHLLFKRDMGFSVDIKDIDWEYKRQNKILSASELLGRIKECRVKTPKIKRKLEILEKKIIEEKISGSSDLQCFQNTIQQKMVDFFSEKNTTFSQRAKVVKESSERERRKDYFSLMGLFLDKQESTFRKMIVSANRYARKEGFSDFCSAKALSEETSIKDIVGTVRNVKRKTDRIWKQTLEEVKKVVGIGNLEQFDLHYGINKLSNQADLLSEAGFFSSLKMTASTLGVDFDKLPIKITKVVNAPPAGVYALGLPKKGWEREITIAINSGAGWSSYAFLFHEFGHAIYYVFSPSSFLLTDSHLSREIMAEMWVGFIEQPDWLILNGFAQNKKTAKTIIKAKSIRDIFQLRSQILETEFEFNIFSDPCCDFKKVWRKLSLDILGVDDSLGVYSEFVFIHPFDIKDYILAWEAKKMFVDFCRSKYGNDFTHSKVVDFLISKFYSPGALVPWNQKLSIFR